MTEQNQWEYRVLSVGSILGAKDEHIERTLNEWGAEGWELVNVYSPEGGGKVTLVAKRLLTDTVRRQRTMPGLRRIK